MPKTSRKSVALPTIVDLDALDQIRDELIDAVESGEVVVKAGAVERVATNALFMLLSAAESAKRNRFSFSISEPSAPFRAAIDRLGIGSSFAAIMKG